MTPPHAPMPWVKLHTTRLDNVRFNRLPDPAKWRWTQLTMLAGRLDAGGSLVLDGKPMEDDEIAWQLRIELDDWRQDSQLLVDNGFLVRNGHGWQLTDFMDEQGPDGKHADQREQWRSRQERHRLAKRSVTRDTPVSHASKSQSQSQESDIESESLVLKSQSVSRELLKTCGVPSTHWDRLTDAALTVDDFLAELSRNYARKGSGKGLVKNPPHITAINLLKGEKPSPDWYNPGKWQSFIPQVVLEIARPDLVVQGVSKAVDLVSYNGYTNISLPENPTTTTGGKSAWGYVLETLTREAGKGKSQARVDFDTWLHDTELYHEQDNQWLIRARNDLAANLLTEKGYPALAEKIIQELTGETISVQFISVPKTEAE